MEYKRFLKKFNSQSDYESQKDSVMGMPHVVLFDDTKELVYSSESEIPSVDYSKEYFTIVNTSEEPLTIQLKQSSTAKTLNYKLSTSNDWVSSTSVTVNTSEEIKFKGNYTPVIDYGIGRFNISGGKFNVKGNIMSLLFDDNFSEQTSLEGYNYAFYNLFNNCTTLTNANELILPATTLADYCYEGMFFGCKSLTSAPQLLATTLANGCYYSMFFGCTSLTTASELPATTLKYNCYYSMFQGCTSLTTAPQLLATTLTENCYRSMFRGCTNLNNITMLATDISARGCLTDWVRGVSSSGTFTKNPSKFSLSRGVNGIPNGWTVVKYGYDPYNYNGHEYVDLNLPSGTLWATSVIGGDNPLYFQWGDTEGWTAEQVQNGEKVFASDGSDYKWNEGEWTIEGLSMTKYNATDGKRILDLEDDAAHVHMGGDWHMPTKEQCEELKANTTSIWTTQNGVNGRLFTSDTTGKSVFVPAFGNADGSGLYGVGSDGYVWCSSVEEDYLGTAWYLGFQSSNMYMTHNTRIVGRCVLGVIG